jgi:hypothetical protein
MAGIDAFFGGPGSNIPWGQITKAWVSPLQVIVAFVFRNIIGFSGVVFFLAPIFCPSLRK